MSSGGRELAVAPGAKLWVHLERAEPGEIAWLGEQFKLDPLALEDLSHRRQRPKIEEFDGYVFLVALGLDRRPGEDLLPIELEAFLTREAVITSVAAAVGPLDEVFKRAANDPALLGRGTDLLLHAICDALVDTGFSVLDVLSDEIEALEDLVVQGKTGREEMTRIFEVKAALVTARKTVSPQRDVFNFLAHRSSRLVSERGALYFRDIHDHLTRLYEQVDSARDLIANVLDAHFNMVGQRTNDQMKKLTMLSAIFLPVSAITGIFGMNLDLLPVHGVVPSIVAGILLLVTPASMYALVRWLRWF